MRGQVILGPDESGRVRSAGSTMNRGAAKPELAVTSSRGWDQLLLHRRPSPWQGDSSCDPTCSLWQSPMSVHLCVQQALPVSASFCAFLVAGIWPGNDSGLHTCPRGKLSSYALIL